jgi:hypothetical protein
MRRGVEIEGFVWAEILGQEEGASLLIPISLLDVIRVEHVKAKLWPPKSQCLIPGTS